LAAFLVLTLGSGALFNTGASCDTRLRGAIVAGSKDFLFNVFLPGVVEDFAPKQ
jgi:hypothetical protein